MIDKATRTALSEAYNYDDIDCFVSDLYLSSLYPETETIDLSRIDHLRQIWRASRMTFGDMLDAAGLTQTEFSALYNIPRPTITHWKNEKFPETMRILVLEALDLI